MLSRREAPEMGKKCVVGWPGKRVDDARVVGADTIDGPTCVTWNNASLAVILRVQYAGCPADPRGDSGGTTQFRLHSVCEGAATNTNLSFLFFVVQAPTTVASGLKSAPTRPSLIRPIRKESRKTCKAAGARFVCLRD